MEELNQSSLRSELATSNSRPLSNLQPSQPPPAMTNDSDSDEWEYEYSTTETETYYLTLDLSAPSLQTRRSQPKPNRGGKVTSWVNPSLGRTRNYSLHMPHKLSAPHTEDTEELNVSQAHGQEDEDMGRDPTTRTISKPTNRKSTTTKDPVDDEHEEEDQEVEEVEDGDDAVEGPTSKKTGEQSEQNIQILDLHSENPIIAYNDHIFSCEWSENLGTELLLVDHDSDDPLPSVRRLPDNVDLLAASSARLVGSLSDLIPKFSSERIEYSPTKKARPMGFEVQEPLEGSEGRSSQSNFIEQFMRLKRARGENDGITVIAQKRMTGAGWRAARKLARDEERAQLLAAVERGVGADEARRRLDILDAEEIGEMPTYDINGKRKPGRRGKGSGRLVGGSKASRSRGRPKGPVSNPAIRRFIETAKEKTDAGLSTPTPSRWGDQATESVVESVDSSMVEDDAEEE